MIANFALVGIGSLLIVLSAQFVRKYFPKQYFALADIVYSIDSRVTWNGVAVRFSIPLVAATAVAALSSSERLLTGGATGFLGAVLLVWPNLLRPELMHFRFPNRTRDLYVVYGMFVAAYTLIALSGALLGDFAREVTDDALDRDVAKSVLDEAHLLLTGVAGSVIGSIVVFFFTRRVRGVERRDK